MKKERNKKKWWIKRQCTLILLTKMGYICFMKINQIGSHKHSKGPTKAGWLVWLCKIKWGPSPYNFGFLSPKQSLWILEPSSSSFSLSLSFLFFIIPSFVSLASRFYSLFHPPKIIPNQQSRLSRWSCSYYCNCVIISIYLTTNSPAYNMKQRPAWKIHVWTSV